MRKIIKMGLCVAISLLAVLSTKVTAEAPIIDQTSLSVVDQVKYYSELYNVNIEIVDRVIQCESRYNPNAHNSVGENSWGLVQINLNAHPDITKEQAIDTNFAINYLVKNISEGNGKMWTCYQKVV